MKSIDYDMIYEVDGKTYILEPDWHHNGRGVYLAGAGLYTTSLEFLGYWHRKSMPLQVIKTLTEHVSALRKDDAARTAHTEGLWKSLQKGKVSPAKPS